VRLRPSNWLPFNASIAACASLPELISTKPKPFERPVSLSVMILADSTVPYWEKISANLASVVA
jgi:hypothetical protein